jgi:hypothetical protein
MIKDRLVSYSRLIVELAQQVQDKNFFVQDKNPKKLPEEWTWLSQYLFEQKQVGSRVRVTINTSTGDKGHLVIGSKNYLDSDILPYEIAIPLDNTSDLNSALQNRIKGRETEVREEEISEVAVFLSSLAHSLEVLLASAGEEDALPREGEPVEAVVVEIVVPSIAINDQGKEKGFGFIFLTEEQFDILSNNGVFSDLDPFVLATLYEDVKARRGFFVFRNAIRGRFSSLKGLKIVPCRFKEVITENPPPGKRANQIQVALAKTENLFKRNGRYRL